VWLARTLPPDRGKSLFFALRHEQNAHMRRVLDGRPEHRAPFSRFREQLEDYMGTERAEATLRGVLAWTRYAEAFTDIANRNAFELPATAAQET
jgi:hypothetical protein